MKTFNVYNKKGKVVATGLSEVKAKELIASKKAFTYAWDFESEDTATNTGGDNVEQMDATEYAEYSVESENTFKA